MSLEVEDAPLECNSPPKCVSDPNSRFAVLSAAQSHGPVLERNGVTINKSPGRYSVRLHLRLPVSQLRRIRKQPRASRDPFDPMDKAFHVLGRERLAKTEHLHGAPWKVVTGCVPAWWLRQAGITKRHMVPRRVFDCRAG
jgi:hypothetical protein